MIFDLITAVVDTIGDLLDGPDPAPAPTVSAPGELHFGGGRWEGTDQWGGPVEQSSTGGPYNPNTSAPVNPNNVTWQG